MQQGQSFTEAVAQKRALAAQREREQKSDATLEGIATSRNIDDVIKELREVQLASLLGGNKPTVILTDQTDLGDKIRELSDKFAEAIRGIDSSAIDAKQVNKLIEVVSTLDALNGMIANNLKYADKQRGEILAAIKALKLSTVVNVPEPKVTFKESKVDFSPLQDTIREVFTPPVTFINLDRYKAQDIDNSVQDKQYIGFLNSEGNWYIIENDIPANKLRYVFGNSGYIEAFSKASSYEYTLLNEAVDALSA